VTEPEITVQQALSLLIGHENCPRRADINMPIFAHRDTMYIRQRTIALMTFQCPVCQTELMIGAKVAE
jgi:hypothetical protein